MRVIKEIMDDMMDELADAEHRIKRAAELKPLYPEISRRESEIAAQELTHADKDHSSITELIGEYKRTKGDPPDYMLEYWNSEHDRYMEKYAQVKCMIDVFGNG